MGKLNDKTEDGKDSIEKKYHAMSCTAAVVAGTKVSAVSQDQNLPEMG